MDKLNRWLMLASHVGILAGLALVGFQLKQDIDLTKIQIFSDATNARMQMHSALMGEDPAPVVMKSLTHPEDLTLSELRIMDAYLLGAINDARLRIVLAQEDLRFETVEEENTLMFYFGNTFAQEWWKQFTSEGEDMKTQVNKELDRIVRSAANTNATRNFFRSLGSRINNEATKVLSEGVADHQE
jgi:hypothetical protein